jgi:hypothetical protein
METPSQEILTAAAQCSCRVSLLPSDKGDQIRAEVRLRFTNGSSRGWIWEHLVNRLSVQDGMAWSWIGEFVGDEEVILFFNAWEDDTAILFERGSCVVTVLSETTGFEFYLTDSGFSYLVCFNHHDFLSCVGRAKEWLERKIGEP